MGSFIGFLDLKKLDDHPQPKLIPISAKDELLKIKVEGITVIKTDNKNIDILLVTDSDRNIFKMLIGKIQL